MRRPDAHRRGLAAAVVLAATLAGCSEPAERVDLPGSAPTSAPQEDPDPSPSGVPGLAPGATPPTAGLPTEARAELRGAERLDADVLAAWTAYQEARAESLRAHQPTDRLARVAAPDLVREIAQRGPSDGERGLTVSLRPLGRLDSLSVSAQKVRLETCMWAPSTGFFVETTGEAASEAAQEWVRYRTDLRRDEGRWTVTQDRRTATTCPGGPPS